MSAGGPDAMLTGMDISVHAQPDEFSGSRSMVHADLPVTEGSPA
jgi:hypothetical protein